VHKIQKKLEFLVDTRRHAEVQRVGEEESEKGCTSRDTGTTCSSPFINLTRTDTFSDIARNGSRRRRDVNQDNRTHRRQRCKDLEGSWWRRRYTNTTLCLRLALHARLFVFLDL
jgi:DnaJ-class molecular chaperone